MMLLLLKKCLLPTASASVKSSSIMWHLSNSRSYSTRILKIRTHLTGKTYSGYSVKSFALNGLRLLRRNGKSSFVHFGTVPIGFAFSVTGTVILRAWYSQSLMHVNCEARQSSRIQDISNNSSVSPSFPWLEFIKLLLPDILYLIAAVASAFAVAIVNIKIPHFLGDIVNVLSNFTGVATKEYLDEIRRPAIKLVAVYGLQGLLTFVYISLLTFVGERLVERLKKKLFASLVQQDIAFFDVHKTGEILSRLTADTQDLKSSFKLCISQGLRSLTQTAGCVVSSYFISPKMTLMMVIVIPSIIVTGWFFGSVLRKLSKDAQAQVAMSAAVADEALGNMRTVRAFAMEDSEMHLFNAEVKKACSMNERLGIGIALFQGLSNFALNGIVLGTLFVGGHLVSAKELSPGDLMAFLVTSQTIQRSLGQMSLLFGQAVKAVAAGARVFEYIDSKPSIPLKGGQMIPFHSLLGAVEYKNVTFTYPSRSQHVVLDNFSLKLAPGTVVAVCGLSGSGKSTMAALLERFYDVQQGSIKLDGVDIRTLDPSWLRGHVIGFISQEPVLFATSVRENIRYSRPDANDSEVYEAAKLANADQFISSFPEGYDTILGERGVTVSGGQKQRIAIARALLKNPSIIILDEATSALDAESEHLVQEALDRVIKGRTVLVIAHRLSTIQNADMIAVLNDGVIAEQGTHAELKRRRGLYWHLIKHQQEERELEIEGHMKYRPAGHV